MTQASAAERHYFQTANTNDFAVVNMNLGWEIPGAYNAAIQVKDLKITVYRAEMNGMKSARPSLP